ncbi:polysaccharide biosynthesis/export family protein [Paraburkholderia metrosideri]|nr:polysaccharide biosynthesis/export family protein [Paraburkholderia metrosideri]
MKSFDVRSLMSAAWLSLPKPTGMLLVTLFGSVALQGCVLPRSGPLLSEVQAAHENKNIVLVPVTAELARESRGPDTENFPPAFQSVQPFAYDRFVPGDGIQITIWENDGLGVFTPGPNGATNLGELIVDQSGDIYLPYSGKVRAQGLTPAQLRNAVLTHLSRLTTGADVSVQPTTHKGQTVTIQGDLTKPGVYPLGPDMARLSGLLSLSLPNQTNPEQLAVTVRRNGQSASVRLADIYRDQADDIVLRPGDSVVVHDILEHMIVLGAAGTQGQIKLSKRNYSVLDALADSRGLSDPLANPRAVFLMRLQSNKDTVANANSSDRPPVVYQFDFTQPAQIALAREFAVHNGDAIYISDAPFTQVQKVLSAFSATLGTARSVSALAN